MRLVQATVEAITQFASLHNELVALDNVGGSAADVFRQLQGVALDSNSSLGDLTQGFALLAKSVQGSRVEMQEALDIYLQHERQIRTLQQQTVAGSIGGLLTEFGGVISGLDRALGISNGIVSVVNAIRNGFAAIRSLLPSLPTDLSEAEKQLKLIKGQVIDTEKALSDGNLTWLERRRNQNELNKLKAQERDLTDQVAKITTRLVQPENQIKALDLARTMNAELTHEVSLMRESAVQQQIRNQLFREEQAIKKLLPEGVEGIGTRVERLDAQKAIVKAAYAAQFQSLNDSLMSEEQLEQQSFQRRQELITGFLTTKLVGQQEHNALLEQEEYRHANVRAQIQTQADAHMIAAQQRAGAAFVNVLGMLGQKSKGFAVASLAISTALNAQRVIQSTGAAVMAAAADPTIPFAAKPAVIAGVKFLGAAELAAVIGAGALSIGGAIKGSGGGGLSGGSGGGGSGLSAMPEAETAPNFGRAVIINMPPGEFFSREQVRGFMDRINDEVANGALLISTRGGGGNAYHGTESA